MKSATYDKLDCYSKALGLPLPDDEHACSVSMPKWEHVVKYEQGCPVVHEALMTGYPRFVFHKKVKELNEYCRQLIEDKDRCIMVLPTWAAAIHCKDFVQASGVVQEHEIQLKKLDVCDATMLSAPEEAQAIMNTFWQHSGELISSRYATYVLERLQALSDPPEQPASLRDSPAHEELRHRVAEVSNSSPSNVYCYPTGMSAIFAAFQLSQHFRPNRKSVMFGFPYLDSLKILKRPEWGAGALFFPRALESDFEELEEILKTEEVTAIFVEFPSNPLPRSTDLARLSTLAHKNGTILIVDDTIGSFNVNNMKNGAADIVVTSLSKIFSGSGNVMGGSLVLNEKGLKYCEIKDHLDAMKEDFIFSQDAEVLVEASKDLFERLARVNATADAIVEKLRQSSLVKEVFYPKFLDRERYESYLVNQQAENGLPQYGPLFSVLIKGGERESTTFFDALMFAKGPSLGTNFTLSCPYTMLAHYDELEFVESCGIDRHLIRVSIGLESFEKIWSCFETALAAISPQKARC